MTYEVGDECVIVKQLCGHKFDIGEAVKVVTKHGKVKFSYVVKSLQNSEMWSVVDEELEPFPPLDESEVEAAIESIKKAQQ